MGFLEDYLLNIGQRLGDKIISLKDSIFDKIIWLESSKHYSKERLLYHIICNSIFDGHAFEFLDERKVISVSKVQPDNRDYIIVGYENSEFIEKYSNKLLCSSNNYRTEKVKFNSFGDSNGSRKDMYRYFRMIQSSTEKLTPFKDLNIAYIKLLDDFNRNLIEKCGELMIRIMNGDNYLSSFSMEDKKLVGFLKEAEYVGVDEGETPSLYIHEVRLLK